MSKCVCGSLRPQPVDYDSNEEYQTAIKNWKTIHFSHIYGRKWNNQSLGL